MRITRLLSVVAFATVMALPFTAFAQDDSGAPKGDAEQVPPGQAQNFGPRKQVQGKRPPLPKVENVATHGKWQVQCTELPKGADGSGGRSCGMVQQARSDKNEKVALSVIVNTVKRGDKSAIFMRVMAPIGVYLPTGIPIEIDGTALPARMVFTRCIPPICEAMGEASPESLAKFKKGTDATFFLYDRPGNGYPLKISLEGFAAALGELDKL